MIKSLNSENIASCKRCNSSIRLDGIKLVHSAGCKRLVFDFVQMRKVFIRGMNLLKVWLVPVGLDIIFKGLN